MSVSKNAIYKYIKSIMLLMTGSVLAQILALCISPVMTRIYSEEQIGEYTLLLTAVNMFGAVICGRYDMSIISEENEENVYSLIKLSALITFFTSVVVSIGYTIYLSVTDSLSLSWYFTIIILFLLLFIFGLTNILTSYNNRNKEYKLMSSVSVIRELVKDAVLIIFGSLKAGAFGLIFSQLIGNVAGLKRQAKKIIENRNALLSIRKNEIRTVAYSHIRQPLFSVPAIFANNFSYSVINIFINHLFDSTTLGFYSMSYRLLGIPLSVVSGSVSKVYFEKAEKDYQNNKNFRKTFLQTSLVLVAFAIPMVIFFIAFAPSVFEFVFGNGWRVSGEYVQILAPMFGIRLVVSSLTPTMIIMKKQSLELVIQSLFIVGVISSFVLCLSTDSIKYFLSIVSIVYSVIYVVYYVIMLSLTKRRSENG